MSKENIMNKNELHKSLVSHVFASGSTYAKRNFQVEVKRLKTIRKYAEKTMKTVTEKYKYSLRIYLIKSSFSTSFP